MNNQRVELLNPESELDNIGIYIITNGEHQDSRGKFVETFKFTKILAEADLEFNPTQQNTVTSTKNVFRGIHKSNLQNKLITCIYGEIVDFAIDLRKESTNYGSRYAISLSDQQPTSILIPKGFGHGYFVKSDLAIVSYLVDHEYLAGEEENFNGKQLVSKLNLCDESELLLSEKDSQSPYLPS
jgi:dTDP-4-dehydrorhamnose 3,5-epimerase